MWSDSPVEWVRAVLQSVRTVRSKTVETEKVGAPIRLRPTFLEREEIELYRILSTAVGQTAIVCPKARAIDVMRIDEASAHLDEAVRLNLRSIGFLICDSKNGEPICAVQADDPRSKLDRSKDPFMQAAFTSAELPVVQVSYAEIPTVERMRQILGPIFRESRRRKAAVADSPHQGPPKPAAADAVFRRRSV